MDNDEAEGIPTALRTALLVAGVLTALALVLLILDFQIKRDIIAETNKFRAEVRNGPGWRPGSDPGQGTRAGVRRGMPGLHDVGHVEPDSGASADGAEAPAAEVVRPGDES